jgi:hypothetical protein
VHCPDGALAAQELIDTVKLETNVTARPHVITLETTSPTARFAVSVELVEGDPREAHRWTLDDVEHEIRVREELREWLYQQIDDDRVIVATDPLYVYYDVPGEGLPIELQRLLVELSDQPEELGALRYAKLEPGALGDYLEPGRRPGETPKIPLHVLTTASALADGAETLIGLRIAEYAPGASSGRVFRLLPEWHRAGMRIFVPQQLRPSLYPVMQPGEIAAEKLAEALLPLPTGADVRRAMPNWLSLLTPTSGQPRGVLSTALARGDFLSLRDSFAWSVSIEVKPRQHDLEDVKQDVAPVIERLASDVQRAVEGQVIPWRAKHEADLRGTLDQFDAQTRQRRQLLTELAAQSAAMRHDVDGIDSQLSELWRSGNRLPAAGGDVQRIGVELNHSRQALAQLAEIELRLAAQHQRAIDLRTQLRAVEQRLAETNARIRGGSPPRRSPGGAP